MKRIGVWNTAFLGDAVLTLPLLQNLRRHFPLAQIDFYVRGGFADLFVGNQAISNVFSYDKRGGQKGLGSVLELGKTLAARHYDLWISPHTSLRSSTLAFLSGAEGRVGYEEAALSRFCYTHRVPRLFGQLPEIERLLALLEPLNVPVLEDWPSLHLPTKVLENAQEFFTRFTGAVIGLHPGSTWATKCWPADYFAEVGSLAVQAGVRVLVFAGPGEEKAAAQVVAGIEKRVGQTLSKYLVHNFANSLNLVELAAFIRHLHCYVSNDSGPMHVAWAQHVPVVAMFGPTVTNFGFAPRGEMSKVHEVALPCRPCNLHGPQVCPKGHHNCMKGILPDLVWQDVKYILQNSRAGYTSS